MHHTVNTTSDDVQTIDTICISGLPGSGKGTANEYLEQQIKDRGLQYSYLGTGDRIRQEKQEGTEFGLVCQQYEENGKLVPSDVVNKFIWQWIREIDRKAIAVIDGAPRTEDQTEPYLDLMDELGRKDMMLFLDVPAEVAEERMIKRGEKAMKNGQKPRPEDVDPVKRSRRLYDGKMLKDVVLPRFAERDKLLVIDALGDIEQVRGIMAERILKLLPEVRKNGTKISDHGRSGVAAPAY